MQVDFGCSSSSNSHARQIQQRFRQTIVNAKFGGHLEATRRVLSQLPISAQSYTSSPYVDLSLYSYDDKWVSVLERPKNCGDHPIRYVYFFFFLMMKFVCNIRCNDCINVCMQLKD